MKDEVKDEEELGKVGKKFGNETFNKNGETGICITAICLDCDVKLLAWHDRCREDQMVVHMITCPLTPQTFGL